MIESPHPAFRCPTGSAGGVLPGPPRSVRPIRTLGKGRAAQAQLVVATLDDGSEVTCVEKVFAPGLLTRAIYRISFQAPFAYQSNADAIAACFFRRRVAAAALAASETGARIAQPLYVRYDRSHKAWVLAAEWIDGRGILPAPPDSSRIRKRLSRSSAKSSGAKAIAPVEEPTRNDSDGPTAEVDQLVELMRQLESMLAECGLVGSGWQVAPRALVSTANLLRTGDRYTIIDLESGIPAVLVPRYLFSGLMRLTLPPFDDLDPRRLRNWLVENKRLLTFRMGPEAVEALHEDVEALIEHSARWKDSEFALFRRPWRLATPRGARTYQAECIRRWQQEGVADDQTAKQLPGRPWQALAIWWAGMLPWMWGKFASRLIGNRHHRASAKLLLADREARKQKWRRSLDQSRQRWTDAGRIPASTQLSKVSWVFHRILQSVTPSRLHRWLVDPDSRRESMIHWTLLLLSPRYQSWLGAQRVDAAIDRWHRSGRITDTEAEGLRQQLCGKQVLAYTRGFGMHLALKTLAPVIIPAKVGGVAAFLASGNLWFLLPMLWTPLMRTLVTLLSAWTTRHHRVPHGEALATGWLPVVGSVAFPLQMFSTRTLLSTFLIRDAASKLGRRFPVYGGADSRTELALIRASDYLIEVMEVITGWLPPRVRKREAEESSATIRAPKTRFGRWLDRHASRRMQQADQPSPDELDTQKIAA